MGRRSLRTRLRLPWLVFRVTRPPVPTPMLWFPLRCTGAEDCPTCAASWQPAEVVPVDA